MRFKVLAVATAAACLLSRPAFAQDVAEVASLSLTDPTRLPPPGRLDGGTAYSYRPIDSTTTRASGASEDDSSSNLISQTFDYGVVRGLALHVTETYGETHATSGRIGGRGADHTLSGFDDPSFGVLYRPLWHGPRSPATLDLSVSYSPDLLSARTASAGSNGTLALGGDALELRAAAARAMPWATVQVFAGARRFGPSHTYDDAGDVEQTSSYWSPFFGLNAERRLSYRWSADVGAIFSFPEDTTFTRPDETRRSSLHPGATQEVNIALNYRIIPFRLVGALEYGHSFYGGSRQEFATASHDEMIGRSGDRFGIRLRYVIR